MKAAANGPAGAGRPGGRRGRRAHDGVRLRRADAPAGAKGHRQDALSDRPLAHSVLSRRSGVVYYPRPFARVPRCSGGRSAASSGEVCLRNHLCSRCSSARGHRLRLLPPVLLPSGPRTGARNATPKRRVPAARSHRRSSSRSRRARPPPAELADVARSSEVRARPFKQRRREEDARRQRGGSARLLGSAERELEEERARVDVLSRETKGMEEEIIRFRDSHKRLEDSLKSAQVAAIQGELLSRRDSCSRVCSRPRAALAPRPKSDDELKARIESLDKQLRETRRKGGRVEEELSARAARRPPPTARRCSPGASWTCSARSSCGARSASSSWSG